MQKTVAYSNQAFAVQFRRTVSPVRAALSTISMDGHPSRNTNALAFLGLGVLRARDAFITATKKAAGEVDTEQIESQLKQSMRSMRMLALVMPFAAVSGSTDTFFIITKAVASFIKVRSVGLHGARSKTLPSHKHPFAILQLYLLLLFVRVLLSWFPTFTWWEQQPWLALRQVTDPYLKLFSGLVPPLLGTIDLTPLLGFFILQFLGGALDVADDETRFWS